MFDGINLNEHYHLSDNSKDIKPNSIFFAIKGEKFDGHNYIDDAIKKGAKIVIHEDIIYSKKAEVIYYRVANSREALSYLASKLFKSKPQNITAVTGTNGKTSIASIYSQILNLMHIKAVSIGTLGVNGSISIPSNLTTPSIIKMHQILEEIKLNKIDNVCLEASSHGLIQSRLDNIDIKTAIFSNISHDHLDYHKTFENYFNAKNILFTKFNLDLAVINIDDPKGLEIAKKTVAKEIVTYGKNSKANFKIIDVYTRNHFQYVKFSYKEKVYLFKTKLLGAFQAYNLIAVLAALSSRGFNISEILKTTESIKPIKGRLEHVFEDLKSNRLIFIDFAHTPDSLEKTLTSLKESFKNKITVVFGCGGDRDKSKRSIMGKIACRLADKVIVTDDNPRTENPDQIRKEILASCMNAIEVPGRSEAIKLAIKEFQSNDIILIAGKGHENYQIIGKKKHHFSDHEEVKKNLYDSSLSS